MDIEIEAGLRATIRKCNAVLGKNPNSNHHKELLEKTQKELDKLHSTKPAKKTKATKPKTEVRKPPTAEVTLTGTTGQPKPDDTNTSGTINDGTVNQNSGNSI